MFTSSILLSIQIWLITEEWEGLWSKWKYSKFADLITTDLENTSQVLLKRVHKLSREVRDKNWEICDAIRSRIDQFKRTMPLIQDLKNDAMRERHWAEIKTSIQKSFEHDSDSFTLEKIIGLGLDQFAEQISEVSAAASKELSIEQVLKEIAEVWGGLDLDIAPYKDRGHFKLRATDEIFQYLEDNQVFIYLYLVNYLCKLTAMLSLAYSSFGRVFFTFWENLLSNCLHFQAP